MPFSVPLCFTYMLLYFICMAGIMFDSKESISQSINQSEFGAVMTTVLSGLFKYCYKYCCSDSRKL